MPFIYTINTGCSIGSVVQILDARGPVAGFCRGAVCVMCGASNTFNIALAGTAVGGFEHGVTAWREVVIGCA